MITFIPTDETDIEIKTLDAVEENQFFIDVNGYLCQKVYFNAYNTIAKANGDPCACQDEVNDEREALIVKHIIPKILKVQF